MVEQESDLAKSTRGDPMDHMAEPSSDEQREHMVETFMSKQKQTRTPKTKNTGRSLS